MDVSKHCFAIVFPPVHPTVAHIRLEGKSDEVGQMSVELSEHSVRLLQLGGQDLYQRGSHMHLVQSEEVHVPIRLAELSFIRWRQHLREHLD